MGLKRLYDARAEAVLATAHAQLQERAAKIDDDALWESFLAKVAANRQLMVAAALASALNAQGNGSSTL